MLQSNDLDAWGHHCKSITNRLGRLSTMSRYFYKLGEYLAEGRATGCLLGSGPCRECHVAISYSMAVQAHCADAVDASKLGVFS